MNRRPRGEDEEEEEELDEASITLASILENISTQLSSFRTPKIIPTHGGNSEEEEEEEDDEDDDEAAAAEEEVVVVEEDSEAFVA
jgi:hypothetical protein